jgi:hypothetical protein
MVARTRLSLLAAGLLSLGLALPAATGTASDELAADLLPESWMPVEIGRHKIFVHREDTHYSAQGTSLGEERRIGTREEEILVAPDHSRAWAELRITTRVSSGAGEEVDVERMFVTPTRSAYEIHGAEFDLGGQRFSLSYPRPVLVLKEGAKAGERWHVSTEQVAGLRAYTWGEVIGIETARTPAGIFEDCLVVRYTGSVEGAIQVPGSGPMQVSDGKVVLTEWHARGIGLVLSQEEFSQTLSSQAGAKAKATVVTHSALKTLRRGASVPAAPR